MTKFCPRCKKTKNVSKFSKSNGTSTGLASWCKACQKETYDQRVARNEELGIRRRGGFFVPITEGNRAFIYEWANREGVSPSELLYEEFCTLIMKEKVRQDRELEKKLATAELPVETFEDLSTTKLCTKCKKIKNRSEFWKNSKSKDGLKSWCSNCMKTYKTTTSYTED